jgi:7,8-dihydropterin-6-yl-methyl-4-(beta-D-ribofuranosyl)aminobenzene 5'-phosphate synthase
MFRFKRFIFATLFINILSTAGFSSQHDLKTQMQTSTMSDDGDTLRITILVDNYVYAPETKSDWGFSCLIEGLEKTILFDTGRIGGILVNNMDILHVDLRQVGQLVLSHEHQDHTGGLPEVYSRNPDIPAFVPVSFSEDFGQRTGIKTINRVDKPAEICRNAFLTGEMGTQIKEQSLIINTKQGLVIITGCSHQGIINILKEAKRISDKDIYLVLGGFHLLEHSAAAVREIIKEFRKLEVRKCGATHCTGEKQIQLFKDAYGNDFIDMGTGRIIRITAAGVELN